MLSFMRWLEAITPQDIQQTRGTFLPDSSIEYASIDGKTKGGTSDRVQMELKPGAHKLLVHTHPHKGEATPINTLPSTQDLESTVQAFGLGYPGMAIFSGPFFLILKPSKSDIKPAGWDSFAKKAQLDGDMKPALERLKALGFEILQGKK